MRGGGREVVTLDGPAASGKSTVARRVAEALEVPFVSSGLLYRAATELALRAGVDPGAESELASLLHGHEVRLEPGREADRVYVQDEDVTHRLHADAVDAAVSEVAAHPRVRAWVNARLREIEGPFVIDGRDMGRDVFPDAYAKFFLTARPEIRAARRVGERAADLDTVTEMMRRRDAGDVRQSGPAPDAVRIDTSDLNLDEVVDTVLAYVAERRADAAT
ncbi:MAG: (d)CMP kinase [Trueperaceae bacterium]|nr:(d)CMP kinase [Trueperaceae bacterium]